jgi:antitoxin YxxD
MTQKSYDYLKPFVCELSKVRHHQNYFYPVSEKELLQAEKKIGFTFPDELRRFYQEIGAGSLSLSLGQPENRYSVGSNIIIAPEHLEDVMTGTLINEETGLYFSRDAFEDLQPGDLPFFEISDSSNYLIMKVTSENPNAVWAFGDLKIEDSFERFIWRLYHERSDFYSDFIYNHYKNLGFYKESE